MKVFMTEFKVGDKIYDGPFIYANSFEEADMEADVYGVVIVGEMKVVIDNNNHEGRERVLH
jgi:hypothetical protein|tara:strand:+ start:226 stop:408 length:183 start_codon:yes stop_codon:yes gene_type:complete